MTIEDQSHKVRFIPEGYPVVAPYVIVHGVAKFLDFLKEVFDATERTRVYNDDGVTIGHAEVEIGGSVILMFDAKKDWPLTPSFFNIYVKDCEEVHNRALKTGATEVTPLSPTNPWGDRGSRLRDPVGNIWWLQTHVEDVEDEEMMKRMGGSEFAEAMKVSTETLDRAMKNPKP